MRDVALDSIILLGFIGQFQRHIAQRIIRQRPVPGSNLFYRMDKCDGVHEIENRQRTRRRDGKAVVSLDSTAFQLKSIVSANLVDAQTSGDSRIRQTPGQCLGGDKLYRLKRI